MTKSRDIVYLLLKDTYITLDSQSALGVGLGYSGPLEEYVQGILTACLCAKCNSPNVLLSLGGADVVLEETRSMGLESYFVCEASANCANCRTELYVKYLFTEYAFSWVFVEAEERENTTPYVVYNLEELADTITGLFKKSIREQQYDELELLTDIETTEICRVLVEGRDDILVLHEFFRREELRFGKDFILSEGFGGGGFESVVSTVRLLKRLKISIPLVAVVDSDGNKSKKEEALRTAGAEPSEIFVWAAGEIEDYVSDPKALSTILNIPQSEVEHFIRQNKSTGKTRLEAIFKSYGLARPDAEMKQLVARHISNTPKDILSLCYLVKRSIGKTDTRRATM